MFKNPAIDFAPEILTGLKLVGTPTATHYLMSRGFHNVYMVGMPPQALQEGQVMVGRARTLRFLPDSGSKCRERNLALRICISGPAMVV